MTLLLDTGATMSAIRPSVLAAIGVRALPSAPATAIVTVSGIEHPPIVTVPSLAALGVRNLNAPVLAIELPPRAGFDGLLGLDFLRGHRLVLDFKAGILEFD